MEVELWPAPKGSYSDSSRFVKPAVQHRFSTAQSRASHEHRDSLIRTGKPAGGTNRVHPAAPARQDLVPVGLVADIPDELVLRRIEDVVHGNCQFDDTQAGAEVATRLRDFVDNVSAQLLAQLAELLGIEVLHVNGKVHRVQKWRRRAAVIPCLDLLHAQLVPIVN